MTDFNPSTNSKNHTDDEQQGQRIERYRRGRCWIILRATVPNTNSVISTDQTMALFTYIILLSILNITLAEDCVINNMPERMAFEKQLRRDLACDPMRRIEPPNNSSNFNVNLKFVLKRFNFDSDVGVMAIQTWMFISWKDERLKWDPEKYYSIKSTRMLSINMWHPGFRLFNSALSNDFDRYYYAWCVLKNTGQVHCVVRITHSAICKVNLTDWPYDQQKCSFEFGAWSAKSSSFKLNVTSRAITMFGADYEAEWVITDYRQEVNTSAERQLKMIFTLDREAASLAAIVVYPAVILTVLSVTSLFLDVRRFVRLSVACFSVLGHYFFLATIASKIPRQNSYPPNLLLYYRSSMVLTVLIILVSFFLRILCKLKSTPQSYIISINDAVFQSNGKYLIFPHWNVDDDSILDIKRFSQDWTKFANIIHCVFGVVTIVAYVSLYCVLVPKPIPFNF